MNDADPEKSQDDPKPKIIVDEDWKEQVQSEKEKLKHEQPAPDQVERSIPEASFPMLVTTLATQATVALGQMAAPDAKEVPVDLDLAKHLIDTLAILEEKTKGNLTSDESAMLTNVVHQLRMLFVAVKDKASPAVPDDKGSIEIP